MNLPIDTELAAKAYPNPTDGTEALYLRATGFAQAAPVAIILRDAMG